MIDIHYNFFLLCIGIPALCFLKVRIRRHEILSVILFGIISALACSVKITGIIIGGGFFLILLSYKYIITKLSNKTIALYLILFGFSALSAIYTLNPFFWPTWHTLNVKAAFEEFPSLFKIIQTQKRIKPEHLTQYSHASNLARPMYFPYMFLRWKYSFEDQKALWGNTWGNNRLLSFHQSLMMCSTNFYFDSVFLILGSIIAWKKLLHSLRTHIINLMVIPLAYFLMNYLFILAFMEINWDRYYLPTVIAAYGLVAIGFFYAAKHIFDYIKTYMQGSQAILGKKFREGR
jgi:hypothetical protein